MNEPKLSQRLLSLDALRGFDMLFIMGFATLVVNVCHLFPGDVSAAVAESMSHPAWHGFSHHDTIFPLFLFIAGISYPFSLAKQQSLGATQGDLYRKILKRGALLILFGLIYNGLFRLDWPMRTASVLGRIGLAWALAAMLFLNFRTRTRIGIVGAILVGYWALLALVPAPDAPAGADVYSMERTIVGYIDRLLLPGKLHDLRPEGPGLHYAVLAVATAMLGMLTGEFASASPNNASGNARHSTWRWPLSPSRLSAYYGTSLINKKRPAQFVCAVAGYSARQRPPLYRTTDEGYRAGVPLFQVIGLNSITIYMAQRIVDFLRGSPAFFFGGLAAKMPRCWIRLVASTGYLLAISYSSSFPSIKSGIFLKVRLPRRAQRKKRACGTRLRSFVSK